MIKRFITTASVLVLFQGAAQQCDIDSLQRVISRSRNDTIHLVLFGKLAGVYSELNPDSAYLYADKMLSMSKKLNLKRSWLMRLMRPFVMIQKSLLSKVSMRSKSKWLY